MSYNHVNVTLTSGQMKKLQSKNATQCGVTLTLKKNQTASGPNKLSLTNTQLKHFNKAKQAGTGVQIAFSPAAVKDMTKTGGIFPLFATLPALIAAAAPAVAKAAALGAVGTASGMALKKAIGGTVGSRKHKKGVRSKTTRNSIKLVSKKVINRESNVPETIFPMSNFDLLNAVSRLKIKHFRGVFMRDQLPRQPNMPETGIINLDNRDGPGTHWVAYAIDPRGIIYFDSYGLAPPIEFLNYVGPFKNIKTWYSTLPTQTLTDPPICGREVLSVLSAISKSSSPPHRVVFDYTARNPNRRL